MASYHPEVDWVYVLIHEDGEQRRGRLRWLETVKEKKTMVRKRSRQLDGLTSARSGRQEWTEANGQLSA